MSTPFFLKNAYIFTVFFFCIYIKLTIVAPFGNKTRYIRVQICQRDEQKDDNLCSK